MFSGACTQYYVSCNYVVCTHQNREDQLDVSDKIAAVKGTLFFSLSGKKV